MQELINKTQKCIDESKIDNEYHKGYVGALEETINICEEYYLEKEKQAMIDHSFNFYYDMSRKMNVEENKVSENRTNAEQYFNETFRTPS